MTTKDDILETLRIHGPVTHAGGQATRVVAALMHGVSFDEVSAKEHGDVSKALSKLEQRGLIVRDQPTLKSCTRIELNGPGVRPGRKSVKVLAERVSRDMATALEDELSVVIDAHVQAATDGVEEKDRALGELNHEVSHLRQQVRRTREERDHLRTWMEECQDELATLREHVRTLERSLESWKRKAFGRPVVRELLTSIRDELDPATRADLDRLMRELPRA